LGKKLLLEQCLFLTFIAMVKGEVNNLISIYYSVIGNQYTTNNFAIIRILLKFKYIFTIYWIYDFLISLFELLLDY